MAQTTQRVIALVAAVSFLLSTLAFTGIVIWQMNQEENISQEISDMSSNSSAGTKLANFDPIKEVESLQIIDLVEGDGESAAETSTVTVHYTGALVANGVIFESSLDGGQPVTFGLNQVIVGWGEGIPGMKVGGKRRLIIPSEKAYGAQSPSPDIPPNSALVFDVELLATQ